MKVQLESLAINKEETTPTLKDVVAYLKELDKNSWDYFSEVFTLVKLILVVPATNALSERFMFCLNPVTYGVGLFGSDYQIIDHNSKTTLSSTSKLGDF